MLFTTNPKPLSSAAPSNEPRSVDNAVAVVVAVVLSVFVLVSQWSIVHLAGGLWRDEANSVNLATLPSVGDIWRHLQCDSFPVFWLLVLHGWLAIVGPNNDFGIRILGFLMGTGVLAAIWLVMRAMTKHPPLLALALLGFNPLFLRTIGANRAYGLSVILLLAAFYLIWAIAKSDTRKFLWPATIVCILCAHTVFYNSAIVLAMIAAGTFVAILRGNRTAYLQLGVISVAVAASTALYLPVFRKVAAWKILLASDANQQSLIGTASDTLNAASPVAAIVWTFLAIACVVCALSTPQVQAAITRIRHTRSVAVAASDDGFEGVYAAVALTAVIAFYAVFLTVLKYTPYYWFFAAPMALTALSIDIIIAQMRTNRTIVARPLAALALGLISAGPCLAGLQTRQTNVDQIARTLTRSVSADDLIVISPWQCGVTFRRYYHGSAPWITVPELKSYYYEDYAPMKDVVESPDPSKPVVDALERTLKSGKRVWLVGVSTKTTNSSLPKSLPPAPDKVYGWTEYIYVAVWTQQVAQVVQDHATDVQRYNTHGRQPVSPMEDRFLNVVSGWHAQKPAHL